MKRAILTLTLVAFLSSLIYSQDTQNNVQKPEFGFKAGVNLSYMFHKFGPAENKPNNTGFYIGSAVNIPFGDQMSLQPEILFSSADYINGPEKLNQLHLPILFNYEALSDFNLSLGPELQYVLKKGNSDLDNEDLKRLLFGGNFSMSYEFTNNFQIQAGYTYTFTKAWNQSPSAYHRINFVRLGLLYFFEKK